MLKKLCILLVITSISLAAVAGTTNKKAQKLYDKALASVEKGQLEKAEKKLLKAIEKDGNFFEAYIVLGKIKQQQGEITEAEKNFEKALAIDSEGAQEVYDILFNIAVRQNNLEKEEKWAVAKLNALKDKISDKDAHNVVAIAFQVANKGNLEKSQNLFKKVREVKPEFLEGYLYAGVIYLKNNKKKDAAKIFQEAVDKNIANEELLNTLSLLYYKDLKDNKKAIPVYTKIIENKSSKYRRDALIDIINIYIDEKDNQQALKYCELFLKDYPTDNLVSAITKRVEKIKHNIEVEKQKAAAEKK
jgi:tetratricopeptide (TPR) repeat protein